MQSVHASCNSNNCIAGINCFGWSAHNYIGDKADGEAAVFNCFNFYNFCPKPPNFSPPWILAASLAWKLKDTCYWTMKTSAKIKLYPFAFLICTYFILKFKNFRLKSFCTSFNNLLLKRKVESQELEWNKFKSSFWSKWSHMIKKVIKWPANDDLGSPIQGPTTTIIIQCWLKSFQKFARWYFS